MANPLPLHVIGPIAHELASWYLRQLTELLPSTWRRRDAIGPDGVVIEPHGAGFAASLRQRGKLTPLGRFAGDADSARALSILLERHGRQPPRMILRLRPGEILSKAVLLPLAALRDVRQVLAFEMDRETPFGVEEVHWSYRIRRHNRAAGRIEVDMIVVPRVAVAPAVAFVRQAGLERVPQFVDAGGSSGLIALADPQERRADRLLGRFAAVPRAPALAAAALAIVLVLAVGLTFFRQAQAQAEADAALAAAKTDAQLAGDLRRQIDQLAEAASFLGGERARRPNPLYALADITDMLPDDSYLTEFSLRDNRVRLVGLSPAAAKLIELLSERPRFREPTFAAPVVKFGGGDLEQFTIGATQVAGPAPAPGTASRSGER